MHTITDSPPTHDYRLRAMVADAVADRDAKVIRGVAVIQAGPLNDTRPNIIDTTTLSQVVRLGNAADRGVKARWTHPNMSSDGLGNFIGRWHNFRMSDGGNTVLADLHLSEQAFKGGDDSRGNWILEMAESDHDTFGVSLDPQVDARAMQEATTADGKQPYRVIELNGIDVVDKPAAVRGGLFGGQRLSVASAPAAATEVLDSLFPDADAAVVRTRALSFLDAYLLTRFGEAPTVVDVDEKAVRVSERNRVLELFALAENAGLLQASSIASQWATSGFTLQQAKAAVTDHNLGTNKLTSDAGELPPDPDEKFRREYRASREMLSASGVSLEDYIASRKVDEAQDQF